MGFVPGALLDWRAAAGFVILALAAGYIQNLRWQSKYKLPPRVPGVPIFGNSFQVPPKQQGPWAKKLAEQYGEMFTCKFGSDTWVFLNSSRVVTDLMEKRSAIYNSRPEWPMAQGIISGGSRIVAMQYNEKWRKLRKIMHGILNVRQIEVYKPYQDLESKQLLWDYLKNPDKWYTAAGRFSNSVIMSVIFGRRSVLGDPATQELFQTMEDFLMQTQPGANLVDAYPILNNLPSFLHWWRPKGLKIFNRTRNCYKREVDLIESKLSAGTQRDCFAVEFLKQCAKEPDLDETTKLFTFGSLMEAGTDTSKVSIAQIIAGACTSPDWISRARKELDAVCGPNAERLPSLDDRDRLPYISAVVKEGFRWRPNIAEIGAPTVLIKDDEYEGYKFPAGTIFTWNAWAIALDEREYEQPERFWPERFLDGELGNPLKGHWAFGPGRRVCVGWHVGDSNVWIAIARLLYCFDFEEDKAHPIDTMTIPQFTQGKDPFAVKIKVRSQAHARLIERECSSAVAETY
ncbi:3-hydroxyphenylacetate 6-hydroxylase [Sphaceloma murrayae]|uniref:3-hydroxyphenylacetate 6-hydroxylase n=1 Tax=Sphaceloma murrayae TaxID=2082308 RepID=A0A2K1QVB2_9PEZI|nr:3-hydroxyphenylacetate 6-hydroxylase [Sphaceloma murrayae]